MESEQKEGIENARDVNVVHCFIVLDTVKRNTGNMSIDLSVWKPKISLDIYFIFYTFNS